MKTWFFLSFQKIKMKKIVLYSTILFIFNQCQKKEATELVKVKKQYSVEIPKSLTKVDFLHADASLQYQNEKTEFYTIVIDEPSADFDTLVLQEADLRAQYSPNLTGYATLLKNNIAATLKNGEFSAFENVTINGLSAIIINASGTVDGHAIYYQFGFVKGRETYYQIVSWTELNRKKSHLETMKNIIFSFKEISKPKKKQP